MFRLLSIVHITLDVISLTPHSDCYFREMKLVKHLLLVILAILKHDFRASGQEPSCEDTKGVLLTERIIRLENDLKRSNELFESLVGKLNGSVTLLGNR